jgi:hypothetical protein
VVFCAVSGSIIFFIKSDTGSLKDKSLYVAFLSIKSSIIVFTYNSESSFIKIFIILKSSFFSREDYNFFKLSFSV